MKVWIRADGNEQIGTGQQGYRCVLSWRMMQLRSW